jgi:hypothetical protein
MGFSRKQLGALKRDLDTRVVRTREANGRQFSYLEGWYVVSEANRIFGHDGWSRETLETKCVIARETRGTFLATYIARVRITVHTTTGQSIVREGSGSGEGRGQSPAEVHDIALKVAETDATKRALATFGKPFGLELYSSGKAAAAAARLSTHPTGAAQDGRLPAVASPALQNPVPAVQQAARTGLHPDDTTPIPRPSHYYGRRHTTPIAEQLRRATSSHRQPIDKSTLAIPEPKRLRDKAHLKFVASQPCLVCGRQPCDPHHLRYAQPRAIGMKVSDEFTVPLCRGHHRALHQVGNETAWWDDLDINALEIARGLWEETHPQLAPVNQAPPTVPGSATASQADNASRGKTDEATEAQALPVSAPPPQL